MRRLFAAAVLAVVVAGPAGRSAEARPIGTRTSSTVVLDTGDGLGGFSVSVGTSTTVLLSSAAADADVVWRLRTFQVTGSSYDVWMGTYTPLTYGSGAGWYVAGSSGSYTTRSQAAVYGILNPSAGAGTAAVKGPYEFHLGEVPK
jgi:hypothetical protein